MGLDQRRMGERRKMDRKTQSRKRKIILRRKMKKKAHTYKLMTMGLSDEQLRRASTR